MAEHQELFIRLNRLLIESSDDPKRQSPAEILARLGTPTASIAVLDNEQIASHCISTRHDDTETLFQACSISKPVAGLALMKLIELGHLSLEDKICDVLPENIAQHLLSDPKTKPTVSTITVKHLMSHTAGVSTRGFPGYPDKTRVPSVAEVVTGARTNTQPVELITLPGLEFMCSGGGITLLQCIMEKVMDTSFEKIVRAYVLDPLGMTRSCYKLADGETNVSQSYYTGFLPTENKWHFQPEQAAAGLWTTPTDLLKVVRALQSSLCEEPGNALSKASAETMLTRIKESMALTWFADDTKFGHAGGNAPGWHCFVFGYADLPWNKNDESHSQIVQRTPRKCGIAVMTNSAMGYLAVSKILHAVTYLKGWPEFHTVSAGNAFETPLRAPKNAVTPAEWKDWIGGSWSGSWELVEADSGLPAARITGSDVLIALRPAAIPSVSYASGKQSIELLFDGLRLMLRLGWDGDERIVEFWNGGLATRTTLRSS